MDTAYHLFVYGSLRSGFRNPAYQYIANYFTLVDEAVVQGKLYDNGEYPVAIPTQQDTFITGELYLAKSKEAFEWAISQLDDYEGLNVENGETPSCKRVLVDAYVNKKPVTSWIYWYAEDVEQMEEIVTGDIMKYLQEKNKPNLP